MPDVFTKRKRSEVMSRIRGKGNKDTEVALAKLLRANHITGWRRQGTISVEGGGKTLHYLRSPHLNPLPQGARRRGTRRTTVRVDFVFRRERVVVFVDGCFWHGCPVHSSPAKWLRKSSMGAGEMVDGKWSMGKRARDRRHTLTLTLSRARERGTSRVRTGKVFWKNKLAANIARDRFVTRALRREGWRVVRIWEHDVAKFPGRCVERVRRAMGG